MYRKAFAALTTTLFLVGCSTTPQAPETPSPEPSTSGPFVSLHAPETATADASVDLVIDSTGHDGTEAQLYVFRSDFGAEPNCSDTGVRPSVVKLMGGPQQVSIETSRAGDMYLVLTADGVQTSCGDTKIRALINPMPEVGPGCEGEGATYNCPTKWPTYKAGTEFTYRVQSAVPPEGVPLPVTVSWVGPFGSAPEAQASPCKDTPVESTDALELLRAGEVGTGATVNGDAAESAQSKKKLAAPGVYRVMMSVAATEYTAGSEPSCEDAPLVTVQ